MKISLHSRFCAENDVPLANMLYQKKKITYNSVEPEYELYTNTHNEIKVTLNKVNYSLT